MIVKPRVFEDGHLPRELNHRGAETERLAQAFKPAIRGEQADDVLLHGPSGVGKTVLARYTLQNLQRRATVEYAYVQCMGLSTAGVIRMILEELPGADPAANTPREDLCLELRERVDGPVIVILDEADDLSETDALPRLSDVDGLSAVPICHNPDAFL